MDRVPNDVVTPEMTKSQFKWPSLFSHNPETVIYSEPSAIPEELKMLPVNTRSLFYFTDFYLAYDETNQILGTLHKTNPEFRDGKPTNSALAMSFNPDYRQALDEEFTAFKPANNWSEALTRLPEFLKPDGLYYTLKPDDFPPHHQLGFVELLHLQHIIEAFPTQHQEIRHILTHAGYLAPGILMHLNTASEIHILDHALNTLSQEKIDEIASSIGDVNALKLHIPWEDDEGILKPGYHAFAAFSQALTKDILLDMTNNPDLDIDAIQDGYALAFKSLAAIGYLASDPLIAEQIFATQSQAAQEQAADTFVRILADQKASSAIALVPVAMFWTQKLGNHAPSGMTPEATRTFYEALTNLNKIANETTGDTEQELALLKEHLSSLNLPRDFSWLDAGSGNGERILGPLAAWFRKQGFTPQIQAVDLLPFAQPENHAWIAHQADITNPRLLNQIPTTNLDLITLTWSVMNDLSGPQRIQALTNMNQMLKTGGIAAFDVTVDYHEQEAEFRKLHPDAPPGSFTREFPTPDGVLVSKGFQAARPAVMHGELAKSGFTVINEISYLTKAGFQRKLVFVKKTGEPLPNPPKPWKIPTESMT